MQFANLANLVTGANPELVDLRFGRVSPLLCIVELMLKLPVLRQVGVCLLLLQRGENQGNHLVYSELTRSTYYIKHSSSPSMIYDHLSLITDTGLTASSVCLL